MGNLVQDLGPSYFNDRFMHSMFFTPDGKPAAVRQVARDGVLADVYSGTVGRMSSDNETIPNEFFKDMSVFAMPQLGWRSAMKGRYMCFITRNNRSYARALAPANLEFALAPHTSFLMENDDLSYDYYERTGVKTLLVAAPEYLKFSDGIKQMADGEILGFAMSANLAIIANTEESYNLHFNRMIVGQVSDKGVIKCNVPMVDRILKEAM